MCPLPTHSFGGMVPTLCETIGFHSRFHRYKRTLYERTLHPSLSLSRYHLHTHFGTECMCRWLHSPLDNECSLFLWFPLCFDINTFGSYSPSPITCYLFFIFNLSAFFIYFYWMLSLNTLSMLSLCLWFDNRVGAFAWWWRGKALYTSSACVRSTFLHIYWLVSVPFPLSVCTVLYRLSISLSLRSWGSILHFCSTRDLSFCTVRVDAVDFYLHFSPYFERSAIIFLLESESVSNAHWECRVVRSQSPPKLTVSISFNLCLPLSIHNPQWAVYSWWDSWCMATWCFSRFCLCLSFGESHCSFVAHFFFRVKIIESAMMCLLSRYDWMWSKLCTFCEPLFCCLSALCVKACRYGETAT